MVENRLKGMPIDLFLRWLVVFGESKSKLGRESKKMFSENNVPTKYFQRQAHVSDLR